MSASLGGRPCQFSLDEIKVATNNFDKKNLLGTGGEGEVYKGHIQIVDGETKAEVNVAIKCLTSKSRKNKFDKEIKLVSTLHHGNLVSLIGYCQELDHNILVYEYICNGNLDMILYPTCFLSWKQILNICIGVARGLDYLHDGTSGYYKIIHRDVKPSNILLDENWCAKLSDFGISKRGLSSNHHQESNPIKTDLRGTFGYYAPEYVFNKEVSRKTDVYAFGVVLLEVLCRKRREWPLHDSSSSDSNEEVEVKREEDIGKWARRNIATDLKNKISVKCLVNFIDIARRCLLKDPKQRPTMTYVVLKLQESLKLQKNEENSIRKNAKTGNEDHAVLYYSSYNSKSTTYEKSDEYSILVRVILKELLRVKVDERNISKCEVRGTDDHRHKVDNDLDLPHLSIGGKYVGLDLLIRLYQKRKLASVLGGSDSKVPRICESCGYARTCHTCVWCFRFAVCKVCDTLTMLRRGEVKQLKCCPNCRLNQLLLRTLIHTIENDVFLHGYSLDHHFEEKVNGVPEKDIYAGGNDVPLFDPFTVFLIMMLFLAWIIKYFNFTMFGHVLIFKYNYFIRLLANVLANA